MGWGASNYPKLYFMPKSSKIKIENPTKKILRIANDKQGKKDVKVKKNPHYHVWDLPKAVIPRSKNNKSKSYTDDLVRLFQTLSYTNKKLQESSQIAVFHIKSINSKSRQRYTTSPKQVLPVIEDFVYHYENFCYRIYVIREKLLQFINAVLPVGYEDDQVSIRHMIINPIVKDSGIVSEIEKFNKKKALGKIIGDRKRLTHRLYYTDVDHYLRPKYQKDQKDYWFKEWSREISNRANLANLAMSNLVDINHGLSDKIVSYKQSNNLKRK
jgi:hypothetical protein